MAKFKLKSNITLAQAEGLPIIIVKEGDIIEGTVVDIMPVGMVGGLKVKGINYTYTNVPLAPKTIFIPLTKLEEVNAVEAPIDNKSNVASTKKTTMKEEYNKLNPSAKVIWVVGGILLTGGIIFGIVKLASHKKAVA